MKKLFAMALLALAAVSGMGGTASAQGLYPRAMYEIKMDSLGNGMIPIYMYFPAAGKKCFRMLDGDLTNQNFQGPICPLMGPTLSYNSTTNELNVAVTSPQTAVTGATAKFGSYRVYQSATVASGVAVFQLTVDGLSTGAPLFPNELFTDSIGLIVNDSTASYQMSWTLTNSNKTLTVTANKLTTANILTGVLGQGQANGAIVRLTVEGR
jgi:hypothetical protein